MKLLMENWRRFLNEAFVSGDPEEVYEKIRDWAQTYQGPSIEVLGLKQPQAVSSTRANDVLTHMLNELKPKRGKIEAVGGSTTIHFDGVTSEDLAPFFEFDYKSDEDQEAGSQIKLFYMPSEQKAKVTFTADLEGLPKIDPTTGDVKDVERREDDER